MDLEGTWRGPGGDLEGTWRGPGGDLEGTCRHHLSVIMKGRALYSQYIGFFDSLLYSL
jgi:hypothetical protein